MLIIDKNTKTRFSQNCGHEIVTNFSFMASVEHCLTIPQNYWRLKLTDSEGHYRVGLNRITLVNPSICFLPLAKSKS